MIMYPQYREARLSGFKPVTGQMPPSLSYDFIKSHPNITRYLLIARRGFGDALGMMIVNPSQAFVEEVKALPLAPETKSSSGRKRSKIWRKVEVNGNTSKELKRLLAVVVSKSHDGSRLTKNGVIPFNGNQVCGWTLERALGIINNSDRKGDYKGIELKAHTKKKVSLITTEPDLGPYSHDFNKFMVDYGYQDEEGNYRFTGLHRHGIRSKKTSLTLKIDDYDPNERLSLQTDKPIMIGLYTDAGVLAAGWSLEKFLSSWQGKHSEVVYVPASRQENTNVTRLQDGYRYTITFDRRVLWCRVTSADKVLRAINTGTLVIDPGHKYVPSAPSQSKRRTQWRITNIDKSINEFYDHTEYIDL